MKLRIKTMAIGGLLTLFQVATPALAEGAKPLDGLRGALEPSGLSIEAEYTGELVVPRQHLWHRNGVVN